MNANGPAIKGVSVPAFWPKKRDAVPRRSEAKTVARFLPSRYKFCELYERLPWPSLRASWCRAAPRASEASEGGTRFDKEQVTSQGAESFIVSTGAIAEQA